MRQSSYSKKAQALQGKQQLPIRVQEPGRGGAGTSIHLVSSYHFTSTTGWSGGGSRATRENVKQIAPRYAR